MQLDIVPGNPVRFICNGVEVSEDVFNKAYKHNAKTKIRRMQCVHKSVVRQQRVMQTQAEIYYAKINATLNRRNPQLLHYRSGPDFIPSNMHCDCVIRRPEKIE